jgi:hypothetical protein
MREGKLASSSASSRLLGYVQLRIGEKTIAVPVQAVKLEADGGKRPGGFYVEDDEFGIYVDGEATERDVQEQIARGSNEAVRHMGRKYLN